MINFFQIIFLFLLNLCVLTFQLHAQENYEIRQVNFHGNKTLDKDFLLENMILKEVSYPEKLLTDNEPYLYSGEFIKLDMERLTRTYQREGFLFVNANLQPLKVNDKREIVKLDILIEEGKPVLIDSISIETAGGLGNKDMDSLMNEITSKLNLTKGERFRDESLKDDLEIIEESFVNLGYAYTNVNYELNLVPEEYKTDIYYSVNPGSKSYIGKTSISGNDNVSVEFIRDQLKYEEGDLYRKSLLDETRKNLYRLQLFRIVSLSPQKNAQTQRSPIPVSIYIEEAPKLSTRFGAGYGTEDKFRTFLDMTLSGFLGKARRLNIYLKHSALEPYSVHLRWIQPQLFGLNSSISFNPFIMSNSEPGYTIRTYGLNIPFTYHFNDRLTGKITYYLENVEQTVEPGDEEFPDIEDDKFPYNKSGLLLSMLFDNSLPVFSPEKGFNLAVGLKLNGHVFGGNYSYTRLWGDFRYYREVNDVVLAFRIMGGGINSADTSNFIPVGDRFYSGGSNSVRGWSRSDLGPKRKSGTPRGGKSIFEFNIEARYHIFWRLSLAAFFEGGNVWENSYYYNLNNLGYAAGPGIRIETPIGPVRFDVGFPLWNEKKNPQFFISVGQAF
jgi:outer membrane protein insertion porin family